MPRVTVRVPAALRMHSGGDAALQLEAASVGGALRALGARHPALTLRVLTRDGQLRPFVKLFLRGHDVRELEGLDTPLVDGDELAIVASVAGG